MSINFDQRYIDFNLERDYPAAPPEEQPQDMPSMDGMQLAAGPSRTMSDAGGGFGSIKAIEPTRFERALQATGLTLEQAGRFLDSLGQVDVPVLGKVSLADFVPFVGSAKEGSRSVLTGGPEWQGTPMALQQAGTGQSLTRGTGMARQLTPDASLAVMDVATNIVPVGKAVAKGGMKAIKGIEKALTPKGAKLTPNVEVPAAGDITKPAFKKWFGDSKVADDSGQPIVVYHARSGDFGEFDTAGRGKTKGTGAFFSSSADVASTYAVNKDENIVPVYLSMKSPVVIDVNGAHWSDVDMSAKVSLPEIKVSDIENQKLMAELTGETIDETATKTLPAAEISLGDLMLNNKLIDKKVNTDTIAKWARKMGYDGVIIKNVVDSGPSGRYMPDAAMEPNDVYVAFNPEQIKSVFNKGTWNPNDPRILHGGAAAGAGSAATMQDKEQK